MNKRPRMNATALSLALLASGCSTSQLLEPHNPNNVGVYEVKRDISPEISSDDSQKSEEAAIDPLLDPDMAVSHPHLHYVKENLTKKQDFENIRILVESDSRNMFVVEHEPGNPQNLEEILFRAPVILGNLGRRAQGTMYTSSFSGPGALWRPKEDPHNPREGVFGRFFMPMQRDNISVTKYEGEWAPHSYNMYAIHGTNNNEAFESKDRFMSTSSRGCVRVYDVAIDDLRNLIEKSAQNLRKIEADYRNPTNDAYVLGKTIPVTFDNYFPQIREML